MIRLERITAKNVWEILDLSVREDQKSFVAGNTTSIIEAYTSVIAGGRTFPFGVYDGDTPVGFLMIGYDTDESWENPPAIAAKNYNLWRLMIDKKHQRKGYGRAAVQLALDFVSTCPCGPAEYCWLSYEPENAAAKALYESFGFHETGEMDGEEVIAALKL